MAIIRLELLSPLLLICDDWWCGWEIIIFVLLVVGFLILMACCGIYFFFATRGTPYNVVMYDSQENKASQQQLIAKYETPPVILVPDFVMQTFSNNAAFDAVYLASIRLSRNMIGIASKNINTRNICKISTKGSHIMKV